MYNVDMISPETVAAGKAIIRRLQEFDPAQLSRDAELGKLGNFSEAAGIARVIVDLYKPITPKVLDMLPENQLRQICGHADQIQSAFSDILNFDPRAPDESHQRSELTSQLSNLYDEIFTSHMDLFAFVKAASIDQQDLLDSVAGSKEKLAKAQQVAENEIEVIRELTAQGKQLVADTATKSGVSQNAAFFKREADQHVKDSRKWMFATIVVAVIAALAASGVVYLSHVEIITDNFTSISSRFVVFASLGYILFLCGKSYFSHRHNAVVNRHRQNALSTYRALVRAASNNESSDIVLNHAAASIFAPQSSGYAKSADAPNAVSLVRSARQITGGDVE